MDSSVTPWALTEDSGDHSPSSSVEDTNTAQRLGIDVGEPLLLVGSFNNWGKDFPQSTREEFHFVPTEESTAGPDEQESHVCVRHNSTKLSFKVISAKCGWSCQIFPLGEGESLKELRLGMRLPAQLSLDHLDKAAHGRNFRIWECANQAVEVHVLLSHRRGVQVWYERVQFATTRPFKDAPHLVRHEGLTSTRHENLPLLQALVRHFGTEGWVHTPRFGAPEAVQQRVLKEVASLDLMMLPGLTPDDFKRSSKPVPKSRTDRILWVDDDLLKRLPGLQQLSNALVRFVELFAEEVVREGHHLRVRGHNRPMLAVYDEGSFFKPHVDVTHVTDPRTLSLVYYMNPGWNQANGGALRLRPGQDRFVDIWPEADSLVLFRADEVLHEVRKSSVRRLALTIWFNRN